MVYGSIAANDQLHKRRPQADAKWNLGSPDQARFKSDRKKRSGLNISQSMLICFCSDPLADQFSRNRRKRNSVAVVPGRNHLIHRDPAGPQDGKLIRRTRAQAAPGLDDFRLRKFRHKLVRGREDFFNAARSDALFITRVLQSCCPRRPSGGSSAPRGTRPPRSERNTCRIGVPGMPQGGHLAAAPGTVGA